MPAIADRASRFPAVVIVELADRTAARIREETTSAACPRLSRWLTTQRGHCSRYFIRDPLIDNRGPSWEVIGIQVVRSMLNVCCR